MTNFPSLTDFLGAGVLFVCFAIGYLFGWLNGRTGRRWRGY